MTTLASIVIVIVGGLLLTKSFVSISKNAEDPERENLCKLFNSLADSINPSVGDATIDVAPDACTTISKDIPEKKYEQSTEGAKRNMADLALKCWDMFLSGKSDKLFGGKFYKSESKCFICYAVNYKKGKDFKSISNTELNDYFAKPTIARDTSDRCNIAGGGKCMDTCSTELPREVKRYKGTCKATEKCCMPDSQNKECEAKGGRCIVAPTGEFTDNYPKWKCPSGQSCYIKKQNVVTYYSAIGEEKRGLLAVKPQINFIPQARTEEGLSSQTYVIAYVDNTRVASGFLSLFISADINDMPGKSVYIGEYNDLRGKCDVQSYA